MISYLLCRFTHDYGVHLSGLQSETILSETRKVFSFLCDTTKESHVPGVSGNMRRKHRNFGIVIRPKKVEERKEIKKEIFGKYLANQIRSLNVGKAILTPTAWVNSN